MEGPLCHPEAGHSIDGGKREQYRTLQGLGVSVRNAPLIYPHVFDRPQMRRGHAVFFFGLALAGISASAALAGSPSDLPVTTITLKDHRYTPDVITVPAGQKIKIEVTNRDATADDFDSDDLHVDRDLKPHERASFVIGPLKPGHYGFKGELYPATAHGEVIAVAPTTN